ncbi:AAA family ATPase [Arcobacter sp. YIC-310]|uniref:AAA family ATPase n=1 Tax=Arcobacter sp. YIC-310 TaxID=3376632 RepID=UPI003C1D5F86
MELVYLWVEEYKNINRQGFNFSPRFRCEFKAEYEEDEDGNEVLKDDCELTIEENEDYVSIFPENINITAIVGENGSGKSNITEAIISIVDILKNYNINYEKEKLFLIYFFNSKFFIKNINMELKKTNQKIEDLSLEKNKCFSIFFNYTLDVIRNKKTNFNNLYHRRDNYEIPIVLIPNKTNKIIDINNMDYHTQNAIIDFAIRNNIDFSEIKEYFMPNKIKISLDKEKIIVKKNEIEVVRFYGRIYENINNLNLQKEELKKVKCVISKSFNDTNTTSTFIITSLKYDINDYLKKERKDLLEKNIENYLIQDWKDITKLYLISKLELISRIGEDSKVENRIKLLLENDEEFINEIIKKGKLNNQKANVAFKFFKKIHNENKLPFEFNNSYINIKKNKDYVRLLPAFMKAEIFNEKNVNFESLSFGQKFMMRFSYNLIYQLNKIKEIKDNEKHQKYTNISLLLDEIELGLHPNWQKSFISFLVKILNKFEDIFNFNIIVTSHSPFILSDIPKENVIFLEKDEKTGNCINATENMKDFNTFGANIHTLLSHGFFMKDGLMGEFAKSKIERIKRFYDFTTKYKDRIFSKEKIHLRIEEYYKSNRKEFEHISSIIGEPFLQKVIKNYLDELEEIFDKENYKQKRLKKLIEEFGEDTLREYLK